MNKRRAPFGAQTNAYGSVKKVDRQVLKSTVLNFRNFVLKIYQLSTEQLIDVEEYSCTNFIIILQQFASF